MELYLYDFSEYDGSDLDEHGRFGYPYLDFYWIEPIRTAFIVTVDGKLAGFVLVNDIVFIPGNERSIAEFFIMRKYRRQGVGAWVATAVFNKFPAKWEVRVNAPNLPAKKFWQQTIAEYTHNQFEEIALDNDDWQGPVYCFDNGRSAHKPTG